MTAPLSPDPIFAAIERWQALNIRSHEIRLHESRRGDDSAEWADAFDEVCRAYGALVETSPTTPTGCIAFLAVLQHQFAVESEEEIATGMATLMEALEALAGGADRRR